MKRIPWDRDIEEWLLEDRREDIDSADIILLTTPAGVFQLCSSDYNPVSVIAWGDSTHPGLQATVRYMRYTGWEVVVSLNAGVIEYRKGSDEEEIQQSD